ncbi:hypothetical protein JCM10049v2_003387 [Rhodotorula toruloides]
MGVRTTGECLACGQETNKLCGPCSKAGIQLFLCSPEHQKLVWQGHKVFCGANAWPISLPRLTRAETAKLLENLDKPTLRLRASGEKFHRSSLDYLRTFLGPNKTRDEIVSDIMSVSDIFPVLGSASFPEWSQTILLAARDTAMSNFTHDKLPSELTLGGISKIVLESVGIGLLAPIPARYDMRSTILFHRLACYEALVVAALPDPRAPDTGFDRIRDAERCKRTCETALKAYVSEAFDAGLAAKFLVKLKEAAPKAMFLPTDRSTGKLTELSELGGTEHVA